MWVSVQFVPQNHVEKIGNIHKDFELYQIFMHIVLCQNFSELYILLIRQIYTLQSKAISKFWSRGISTVSAQKSQKKNMQYSQRFLELYQLLIYAFIRQTVSIFLLCVLPKVLNTWLFQFCVITYPQLIYFWLYTIFLLYTSLYYSH